MLTRMKQVHLPDEPAWLAALYVQKLGNDFVMNSYICVKKKNTS